MWAAKKEIEKLKAELSTIAMYHVDKQFEKVKLEKLERLNFDNLKLIEENSRLREQIEKKEKRINSLWETIREGAKEIQRLREQIMSHQEHIEGLNKANSWLQEQIESLKCCGNCADSSKCYDDSVKLEYVCVDLKPKEENRAWNG